MTTARQVKSVYIRLMQRYPDYKITGSRFLCKIPVNHFACGVFIERTREQDCFQPRWAVTPLFVRRIFHYIPLGTIHSNLVRSGKSATRSWLWSDPTMVADLIEQVEADAMPKITFYQTVEAYATLPPETYEGFGEPPEDLMLVHIALGEFDAARKIWDEQAIWHRRWMNQSTPRMRWLQEQLATVFEPLFAGDRPALAKILHDWEAANVRGTEIERYWEPTPFPLEL